MSPESRKRFFLALAQYADFGVDEQASPIVLRSYYLRYRQRRAAASGRMSAEMIYKRNVLESKLQTRAQMRPHELSLSTANSLKLNIAKVSGISPEKLRFKDDLSARIAQRKAAQAPENLLKAYGALNSFLAGSKAGQLQQELEWLADHILSSGINRAKYVPGPIKKIGRALEKTTDDYGFGWGENKDLVRGTLACEGQVELDLITSKLVEMSRPEYGIGLIKQEEKKATRDGGREETGYSGWNFGIQFKDHRDFAAELQVNLFAVMYGKESKKKFMSMVQFTESEYGGLQNRLMFPGGLGHALYEISRSGKSSDTERRLAAVLSADYYDACRGKFRFPDGDAADFNANGLNRRIHAFQNSLERQPSLDAWKHAAEGSGWTRFPLA